MKSRDVRIVCGDAALFEFPDGPLVVFFYHSFGKEVLIRVLEQLFRRADETIFVYYNVHHEELFSQFPVLHSEPGLRIWRLV
jgi:hypothetical protein